MMSPQLIERPGRWVLLAVAPLALAFVPAAFMIGRFIGFGTSFDLGSGFAKALQSSLLVAGGVALVSFAVGLPVGVLAVFYRFPARASLLGVLALPLFVPPFLWAIGLSVFRSSSGLAADGVLGGDVAAVAVFCAMGVPLVMFATMLAAAGLAHHPADAARLAGGERVLLIEAAKAVVPPATLAAGLAAVLSLSDAGPAMILGGRSVAAEMLTSFAALYDYDLATRQCLALSALVLLVALPASIAFAGGFRRALSGRDLATIPSVRHPVATWLAPVVLALPVAVFVGIPLSGLLSPLTVQAPLADAAALAIATLPNTLLYAGGPAVLASVAGFAIAVGVGHVPRVRALAVALAVALLCLPPSLIGLGIARAATEGPPALDWALRSRLTVCVALAVRFLPVALLFGLRSMASVPSSRVQAAAIHGVGLGAFATRILIPALAPGLWLSFLTVALLASGEVGIVLLLRPPGEDSLPVALFTIMANAPAAMVAVLCVVHLLSAAVPIALVLPRLLAQQR